MFLELYQAPDTTYPPFSYSKELQLLEVAWDSLDLKVTFNPHRLFPPTLERLHIDDGYGALSEADKFNVLEILLESKNDSFSNMSQVYLAMNPDASERLVNFKARAAKQGIEFKPITRKTNSIWCACS
jgi:hypothetical protein